MVFERDPSPVIPSLPDPSFDDPSPTPGTVLSERYRVVRLIGEGRMGRVYAAEHTLLRKKLAIKILRRNLLASAEVVARFQREAMASANIEHPNIAAATDFGKLEDGSLFLVLEYVEGRTLRADLTKGPLSLPRALHIARQIASALASAQALEIVHRDLKPENVMLIERDQDPDFVKVLDFGIARTPNMDASLGPAQALTKAGMVFGTPEYMAPEQALGQPVDTRADLYSLGVLLFEMIAGTRPFQVRDAEGIVAQQVSGPPPSIAERAPGQRVPRSVEELVQQLLQKDVALRFARASAVVEAIDGLLGTIRSGAPLFTPSAGSPSVPLAATERPPAAPVSRASAAPKAPSAAPRASKPAEAPRASKPGDPGRAVAASQTSTFLPGDPLPSFALHTEYPAVQSPGIVRRPPSAAPGPLPPPSVPPPLSGQVPSASTAPAPTPTADIDPKTLLAAPKIWVTEVSPSSLPPSSMPASGYPAPPASGPSPGAPSKSAPAGGILQSGFKAVGELARAIGERALRLFGRACVAVEQLRPRLPKPLREIAAGTLVLASTGFCLLLLVVFVAVLGRQGSPTSVNTARVAAVSASAAPSSPPVENSPPITASAEPAPSAPASPAEQSFRDASALIDVAGLHLREHREGEAVSALARALAMHANLRTDSRVSSLLFQTARSTDKKVEDSSFGMLQGVMAGKGAEVVYQLAVDKSVRESVRRRAEKWLRSDQFERASSASLYSAVKLRYADTCEKKYELLSLAGKVGGRQTLEYLRELESKHGCGLTGQDDCFPCLRSDNRLSEVIAQLQQHANAQP